MPSLCELLSQEERATECVLGPLLEIAQSEEEECRGSAARL